MVIGERDKNSKSNSPFFGPNRRITCSWVKSVNKVFVCWLGELCWVTVGQLICQPRLEASFPPDCWLRWRLDTHTQTHSPCPARSRAHTLPISLAWLNLEEHLTVKELQTCGVTHAGELPSLSTCTPLQSCSALQWPSRGSLRLTDPQQGWRHLQETHKHHTHYTRLASAKGSFASVARLVFEV